MKLQSLPLVFLAIVNYQLKLHKGYVAKSAIGCHLPKPLEFA